MRTDAPLTPATSAVPASSPTPDVPSTSSSLEELTLSDEKHTALVAAVNRHGMSRVGKRLRVGPESLARLVARLPVRRGTLALAVAGIDSLESLAALPPTPLGAASLAGLPRRASQKETSIMKRAQLLAAMAELANEPEPERLRISTEKKDKNTVIPQLGCTHGEAPGLATRLGVPMTRVQRGSFSVELVAMREAMRANSRVLPKRVRRERVLSVAPAANSNVIDARELLAANLGARAGGAR